MLTEIAVSRRGCRHGTKDKPYFAVSKAKGTKSDYVIFYLSTEVMKELRWIIGDKAAVLLDQDAGFVHLRRVKEDGYTISAQGKVRTGHTPASISIVARPILPAVSYTPIDKGECAVIDGDFVFPYPFPK